MREEIKITEIPIQQISTKKNQPRKRMDKISELAVNIKKNGLINPISVEKTEENKYKIISGERRYRAMTFLKWKTIPCIVRNRTKYDSLAENFCREDLNIIEKARAIDETLRQDFGRNYASLLVQLIRKDLTDCTEEAKKVSEVCLGIGYAPEYIYSIIKVLKINKEVQDKILEKGVGAQVAIKLSVIKSKAIQEKMFKLIEEGLPDFKIIKAINAEKFLEQKKAGNSLKQVREVFFAYQNFGRSSSHLKKNIPTILNLIEAIPNTRKKTLIKDTEALIYLLSRFKEKNFLLTVNKNLDLLEELRTELETRELN